MYQIFRNKMPVCTMPNFDCVDWFLWDKGYPEDYYYLDLDILNKFKDCRIEHWRKPDVDAVAICNSIYFIWYGPEGINGDCATEIVCEFNGFTVRQYESLIGYIDDIESLGENTFLLTETFVSDEMTNDPLLAAAIGVAQLAYHGSQETFVAALPE